MKTKALLLAGLVTLAGVAASEAQTVYSVNAVGFVNVDVPVGFSMISNPLISSDNTLNSLITGVPVGTTIYKFNPVAGAYTISATYAGSGAKWQPNGNSVTLVPGEGAFIQAGSAFTITFTGEVAQGAASNSSLVAGFQIVSSTVPAAANLSAMGIPAQPGDTVYTFNTAANQYASSTFTGSSWLPQNPTIAVGQAFFLQKSNPASWNRNFTIASN